VNSAIKAKPKFATCRPVEFQVCCTSLNVQKGFGHLGLYPSTVCLSAGIAFAHVNAEVTFEPEPSWLLPTTTYDLPKEIARVVHLRILLS
jgi:hypothetical protein